MDFQQSVGVSVAECLGTSKSSGLSSYAFGQVLEAGPRFIVTLIQKQSRVDFEGDHARFA